jgi:hypothetical protein
MSPCQGVKGYANVNHKSNSFYKKTAIIIIAQVKNSLPNGPSPRNALYIEVYTPPKTCSFYEKPIK